MSLPDFVLAQLREAILNGTVSAGALLRQEDIARQLGVSRPPVREALKLLEAEGLAVSRPRRGYVVASLDPQDIEEIFDIRMILEERAGYLAARQRTEDDIRELAALLEAMEGLSTESRDEIELFSLRNRAFHDRIFRTTGRQRLCRMMLGLRDSVERYVRLGAWMAGSMEQVRGEHRAIFDAFRQGDAERMAWLCREHVRSTGERLIRAVRDGRRAEAS